MYTLNDFNTFETIEDIKVICDLTTEQAFVIYELSAGNLKLMKTIANNDFNTFKTIEDIKVIYNLTTEQALVIYELSKGNLRLMKAIADDWNYTGLDFDAYIDEGVFYITIVD